MGPLSPVRLGLSRRNSGEISFRKIPETLSDLFQEFPLRAWLGPPTPFNSRHLKAPEHYQNSLPPQYGSGRFFFLEVVLEGPLRAGHGIPSSIGVFLNFFPAYYGATSIASTLADAHLRRTPRQNPPAPARAVEVHARQYANELPAQGCVSPLRDLLFSQAKGTTEPETYQCLKISELQTHPNLHSPA